MLLPKPMSPFSSFSFCAVLRRSPLSSDPTRAIQACICSPRTLISSSHFWMSASKRTLSSPGQVDKASFSLPSSPTCSNWSSVYLSSLACTRASLSCAACAWFTPCGCTVIASSDGRRVRGFIGLLGLSGLLELTAPARPLSSSILPSLRFAARLALSSADESFSAANMDGSSPAIRSRNPGQAHNSRSSRSKAHEQSEVNLKNFFHKMNSKPKHYLLPQFRTK